MPMSGGRELYKMFMDMDNATTCRCASDNLFRSWFTTTDHQVNRWEFFVGENDICCKHGPFPVLLARMRLQSRAETQHRVSASTDDVLCSELIEPADVQWSFSISTHLKSIGYMDATSHVATARPRTCTA